MTLGNAMRWAVSAGWSVNALLLERILTLGGITDTSGVSQNPPLLLVVGVALIVLAVCIAILVAADWRAWPVVSMAVSTAYMVVGIWLRLENGDDSGAAIAMTALLVAVLSRAAVGKRRRDVARSAQPPSPSASERGG